MAPSGSGKPSWRVSALLPAPAGPYFLERDSAAFRSLLSKTLKIGQLEFQDLWREGSSTFVKIVTKPEFGSWVPKSVASQLQSSNLEFIDVIEYDPAAIAAPPYRIFIRTQSPFLGDKLDVRMAMTIEEAEGGAACRQTLEGHIKVKMFGVGRIIEGIVKDSLSQTYKKLPEIVRRWQLFREEALRSGDGRQLLLGRPPVGCEVQWIRQEVLQILKEPLLEDAALSPISSLCPMAGASEASDDSPAGLARTPQRSQHVHVVAAGEPAHVAEEPAAAAAAGTLALPVIEERAAEAADAAAAVGAPAVKEALEDDALELPRRDLSVQHSVYYDAPEAPDVLLAEASSPAAAAQAASAGAAAAAAHATPSPQLPPHPASPPSTAALAAAALSRGALHRRTVSADSAASGSETPLGEDGLPQPRQPGSRRFWRRFNRDYTEWEAIWDEVGVEQPEVEEQPESAGVVGRALLALEGVLRDSYYSTSILVALFLMRALWGCASARAALHPAPPPPLLVARPQTATGHRPRPPPAPPRPAGHGWLRVEPDADAHAHAHDERTRQHYGHRHTRTRSGSSGNSALLDSLWPPGGLEGPASARRLPLPPTAPAPGQTEEDVRAAQQASLARVAQEVCSRMVTGSRKVAAAPVRAVVAAGTSMRQASMTGARALSAAVRPRSAVGDDGSSGSGRAEPAAGGGGRAAAAALDHHFERLGHHRKTMSLDTGTAVVAQHVAAAALLQQQGLPRKGGGAAVTASSSPTKELQRRESNLADQIAMKSLAREDGRVRAPSRLSCFTICGRRPAVKE